MEPSTPPSRLGPDDSAAGLDELKARYASARKEIRDLRRERDEARTLARDIWHGYLTAAGRGHLRTWAAQPLPNWLGDQGASET